MANRKTNKTEHHAPLARAYAQAVLDLANDAQQAEAVREELRDLAAVLRADDSFRRFLSDPGIGQEERREVLRRAFGGQVSELTMKVLGVLNGKGSAALLPEIADAYGDLLDRQQGKVDVAVTVAQALSEEQLQAVRERVSAALQKNATIHQRVDESIIGGLVLQVEDRLIDASVRTQLAMMRQQMLAGAGK